MVILLEPDSQDRASFGDPHHGLRRGEKVTFALGTGKFAGALILVEGHVSAEAFDAAKAFTMCDIRRRPDVIESRERTYILHNLGTTVSAYPLTKTRSIPLVDILA